MFKKPIFKIGSATDFGEPDLYDPLGRRKALASHTKNTNINLQLTRSPNIQE